MKVRISDYPSMTRGMLGAEDLESSNKRMSYLLSKEEVDGVGLDNHVVRQIWRNIGDIELDRNRHLWRCCHYVGL